MSYLVIGGAFIASLGDCAFAQLVPDTTLGSENSRVTPISPTIEQINGGATRGANLFHSFQEFNVNEGRSVYFTNPAGIENILTRVTGTNPSDILGTLGVTGGNANLFLINPNGIIFGSNARLDVGGSFVASTASSIKFADGTEFSAVNPSAPPLLTISVPIGLQFNGTEGDIVVQGSNQTPAPDNPFTEVGDAGQLPGTAQPVNSPTDGTSFNAISGNLDNGNDVDLYQLFLTEGQPFTASTVDGTEVDTQLFLFDSSGLGLSSNDDTADTFQSTVPLNEPFTPAASGTYYLGISSYNNDPRSSQGYIFGASDEPTGSGAGLPLSQWDANNDSGSGAYTITLNPQPDTPTPSPLREGLQVQPGRTLALVGGNVVLEGGHLAASGGRIELGSVAGEGLVSLSPIQKGYALSYQGVQNFQNIQLSQQALVDASGEGGGDIQVQAAQLELTQNSYIFADTLGAEAGGEVLVHTTDAIALSDGSLITADVVGSGSGGNLKIETGQLIVRDGARIRAGTFGEGQGGNLTVTASESVELIGMQADGQAPSGVYVDPFSPTSDTSGLFTRTSGAGSAGNLTIATEKLTVRNGAGVATDTRGEGRGGNLTVNAPESVEVIGLSFLSTETRGTGAAGDLTIETGKLLVRDSALVSTESLGEGPGGMLEVTAAKSVELIDIGVLSTLSFGGDAGSVTITTGKLLVQDGSGVTAFTAGAGRGGNITVTAWESVELSNKPDFAASGFSSVTQGARSAGDITISTGKLNLQDGGQVTTRTFGGGRGGNITVTASESVELIGTSADGKSSSGLFSTNSTDLGGIPQAIGAAGDVTIATRTLIVRDGAEVNVSSEALGNAGSLRVQADSIFIDNQGKLQASTASQEGGNINLQVRDLILMRGQGLISAKAENNGNGGNVTINAPFIVAVPGENSDIIANAFQGRGGNINITTQGIYGLEYRPQLTPNSDINASSRFGVNGTVQINTLGIDPSRGLANLPTEVVDASDQIDQTCSARGAEAGKNTFTITGRGGLPTSPYEPLSSDEALEDIQPPSGFSSRRNSKPVAATTVTSQTATSNPKPPIVEAQGWVMNNKGQVVLTATTSTSPPHNSGLRPATCPSS